MGRKLEAFAALVVAGLATAACGEPDARYAPAGSTGAAGHGGASSATTGTVGTNSTTTGTGGQGGCAGPSDCPQPSACVAAVCTSGVCGTTNVPRGTLVMKDTPGDCMDTVCDGMGATMQVPDDENLPTPADPCLVGTCSNGVTGTADAPARTPCDEDGGVQCDGMGACIQCFTNADCAAPMVCSTVSTCVPPACTDGEKDGSETDVDCGGVCPPCALGQGCMADTDCASIACDAVSGTCVADPCSDHRMDGNESARWHRRGRRRGEHGRAGRRRGGRGHGLCAEGPG